MDAYSSSLPVLKTSFTNKYQSVDISCTAKGHVKVCLKADHETAIWSVMGVQIEKNVEQEFRMFIFDVIEYSLNLGLYGIENRKADAFEFLDIVAVYYCHGEILETIKRFLLDTRTFKENVRGIPVTLKYRKDEKGCFVCKPSFGDRFSVDQPLNAEDAVRVSPGSNPKKCFKLKPFFQNALFPFREPKDVYYNAGFGRFEKLGQEGELRSGLTVYKEFFRDGESIICYQNEHGERMVVPFFIECVIRSCRPRVRTYGEDSDILTEEEFNKYV